MSFKKVDNEDKVRPEGKTCILAYGYNDVDLELLKKYSLDIGIEKVIKVEKNRASMILRDLIEEVETNVSKESEHVEKTAVLNAVSDYELNQFVGKFKTLKLARPLFAVVTENSIDWKFEDLISELIEERAEFIKRAKKK